MKPERRDRDDGAVIPRVTPGLRIMTDRLDFEHYDSTGEELFIETIEQTEYGVDPFDEDLAPEAYWAEGWDLGDFEAYRNNAYNYDGVWHRMFPTRYRVADFNLSRGFRRVLKNNADLRFVVRPFRTTPAKDVLHQIHCYSRFHEIKRPLSEVYTPLRLGCAPLRELTVFHPTRGLIAFSLIEIGEKASYAVSTVWNPDENKRSLGTFVFLKAVEFARSMGYEHHYVGPTILADRAFSYKLRYPACELYDWAANDWVASDSERARAMFAEPFPRHRDPEMEDQPE